MACMAGVKRILTQTLHRVLLSNHLNSLNNWFTENRRKEQNDGEAQFATFG